jgi:hypothetical protein
MPLLEKTIEDGQCSRGIPGAQYLLRSVKYLVPLHEAVTRNHSGGVMPLDGSNADRGVQEASDQRTYDDGSTSAAPGG